MTADLMYTTVYLICNFFTVFIIHKFFRIFFEPSDKPKWMIAGAYGIYFAASSLLYLTVAIPILTLFCNLLCFYIISLLYNSSLRKRLVAVIFTYVFMLAVELVVTYAVLNYGSFRATEKVEHVPYFIHIILCLVSFTFANAISCMKNTKRQKLPDATQFVSSVVVAFISIYLIFVIHSNDNISRITMVLSIAGILAINILQFILYDNLASAYLKNMETALLENEKVYYQHECEMMKTTQDEMTAFRHDLQNHLAILSQMLEESEDSAIQKYISDLKEKTKSKGIYSNSGNLPIDSIINYKLRNADELGIQATVNVAVPENLNIEIADIVTILGNLLDNAIQAMLKTEEERTLFFKVIYTKGRLFITARNTFDGEVNYQNGKIISRKEEANHGYGLKNIENTLKKYNGSMRLSHDASLFSVDAMLYVS